MSAFTVDAESTTLHTQVLTSSPLQLLDHKQRHNTRDHVLPQRACYTIPQHNLQPQGCVLLLCMLLSWTFAVGLTRATQVKYT